MASAGSAGFSDRLGKFTGTVVGIALIILGQAVMAVAGSTLWIGVTGILIFLFGFEFAFVSSLTLVTEAAPSARGKAIGISNACGTIARAGAVVTSGQLYETFGMTGSITLAAIAATIAVGLTLSTSV